jgi:hypothetical protein
MDPIRNPFSPGAGSRPPELVGRDAILDHANVLLARVALGRPEKSMLLTGLRGVGKTVLLNEVEFRAREEGHRTVLIEASEDTKLAAAIAPHLRRLLFDLDRIAATGDKVRRALAVFSSFVGRVSVTIGPIDIGVEPELGAADSGDLEVDLTELFVAVAEAARERGVLVVLLIDEVQYFDSEELGALIVAMHRIQQRGLPLVLIGAGLPVLPGLAGAAKSYAERLLAFPDVGPLGQEDAFAALREPAREHDVDFSEAALTAINEQAQGCPYFLQEWGYQAWNSAGDSPIDVDVIRTATPRVIQRLDMNFFRVRFDRLTPSEKRCLRAMAELGAGPHRTGDVAQQLGFSRTSSLSPVRSSLIHKGMVYSPSHGDMAFTVPLFDQFMKRAMPEADLS